ncbi:hypothetical protein, partial [Treponema sp.]|uniref:hypothetical protein n=1 Tax=Treponema sp. TaxID=166 RepID=UPI00388D5100
MFFRINIFFPKIKNFLFLPLIILPVIHISASEIQNTLSDNARISILSVNYTDLFHSLFSKSCIRIYDKENGINQLVD